MDIRTSYCDYHGKPMEPGEGKPNKVEGHPDSSGEQVCSHCRAQIAEFVEKNLKDKAALRKIAELVKKQAPRGQGEAP